MAKVEHNSVPADWTESLDRSMAQIAKGQTVPVELVLQRLRKSLAHMEANHASQR